MKVEALRNYGVGFSDAEGAWPPALKKEMKRKGKAVVMRHLTGLQKLRFLLAFLVAKYRARAVDLSAIRAKGLANPGFLAQQVEYLCLFKALARVLDTDRAVSICERIMDETARKALLLCLPRPANVRTFEDPMAVFREYLRVFPQANAAAGCAESTIAEDDEDAFQFNVTWCVWYELAKAFDVPEACLPNCYSDDLVFPEYFGALGIEYKRTQTLACGGSCCDFRFERCGEPPESVIGVVP